MTVTFCGHSDVADAAAVQVWLDETITQLCHRGARRFLLGGYGHFDRMAAAAVWQAKTSFPEISSVLVLPYINKKADMTFYDYSLYPSLESVPKRYAILKRNQSMVDEADIVVAYVLHDWGGAVKTLDYAMRKGKTVIRFGDTKLTSLPGHSSAKATLDF